MTARLSREEARRILGDALVGKKQKFNRPPTSELRYDGFLFDSKGELSRYCQLKAIQRAKRIHDLVVHPTFPITINGFFVCDVELDFQYRITRGDIDEIIYEDVKVEATNTHLSRLKRKLLGAVHGIKVKLITPPRKGWAEYGP